MGLKGYLVAQFRRPRGPIGHVAGWVMSRRASNQERNRWTLDILEIQPGHRVLEIGFGPGYAIERLLTSNPSVRVLGIDHSEVMVRQATLRNRNSIKTGQAELLCASTDELASLGSGFDRIYSANVAQFWKDRVRVFQDILKLLRPGGRVATTYLPRHQYASDTDAVAFGEKLLADMRAAGFEQVSLKFGPRVPVLTVCAVGRRLSTQSD
jgi:ubiquinone/menaquinone biosynthesis C-methylase UbiE